MSQETEILLITAASIGFFHTLLGPDHYLPFVALSKARQWSLFRTVWITVFCGVGHVAGSLVLGVIGVGFGVGVGTIDAVESTRGEVAAWGLIVFGLVYFAWGIKRMIKGRPHSHTHLHGDGTQHEHLHVHSKTHTHVHSEPAKASITPWVMFIIFMFGPCEPLIPILMYPAAQNSWSEVFLVAAVFGIVTIATMVGVILIALSGIDFLPSGALVRYSHPLAGLIIFVSGAGIKFFGL
jgi:sulfite exporter TauE/SafE